MNGIRRIQQGILTVILSCTMPAAARCAEGALAGLPSKAGPHVEKVKQLGDNEWLELGQPAPDRQWGRARGRSWMAAMPLAVPIAASLPSSAASRRSIIVTVGFEKRL